jgi:uncharacterized protein
MSETPAPAATPDSADPSMEDILASIRRILNEEETPADAAADHEAPVDDDVLVLDQSMMVAASEPVPDEPEPEPEPERPAIQLEPPILLAEPAHHEAEIVPSKHADPPESLAPSPELMAPETAAAAAFSVGNLVRTLAAGRSTQVYSGGPTLEDVVRAELRPLLKEWLDANLPPIVERLVRSEIERVVGRAVP